MRGVELACRVDNQQTEMLVRLGVILVPLMTGDLQTAKTNLENLLKLAERLRDTDNLATTFGTSAMVSIYEGDWEAARRFSDQALALAPVDTRNLAVRLQMEFELGEFEQSQQYLERLVEAMRLMPPGPNSGYALSALGIPLWARATGAAPELEVAEAAADAVLSTPNAPTLIRWGAKAGLGFLAVHRNDPAAAADHYASLLPSRGTSMQWYSLVFDRLLGLLAQTIGRSDLAAEHFEDALAFCRKGGYRPELAWTYCDYADLLLQRDGEGDRARATSLLDESLAISSGLGMRPLMERVLSRREILRA